MFVPDGAVGPGEPLEALVLRFRGLGHHAATTDRDDLDAVSESRPVVAFREDMHVASVNSVVLDRFVEEMPTDDVEREGGDPTGVLVEEAVDVVYADDAPGGP